MPARFTRFSRKSQFAKFGSINTFKSVNWMRKDAWPIHVMATWPLVSLGKTGTFCSPVRFVINAFQIISWKNVAGLKWFDGVRSLNDLGTFLFCGGGLCTLGLLICLSIRLLNPVE